MDPSCLEVNLNKVRCYCENDKCTVPPDPTYTTSFKMFCHKRRFWSRWCQHGKFYHFSCSQCDSTFTEKTNVTRHIREKHQIEQGNKNFRRKLQLMSQKQLGNIVLKAINPQETLSAAEKSMLDKFHEELATIMSHFTDSIDNVYNSDVLAAIVTKNMHNVHFLLKPVISLMYLSLSILLLID